MTTRYYLSSLGVIVPHATTEDHADVGRRILAEAVIVPQDYADIYDQMEKLGYFRVAEFTERIFAENKVCPATCNQLAFLLERVNDGNNERLLLINDELFTETRREGGLTYQDLHESHCGGGTSVNDETRAPK